MKRILLLVLVMLYSVSFISCSHVQSYMDVARDEKISRGYQDVLNRWTKKEIVYSQFETRVQITATYKSDAFNRAYNKEYARIYYLTAEESKRREEMEAGFTHDFREIIFYAAMPNKEANDFEKANSTWSVFLSDEKGTRIAPIEIRKIEKITPLIEAFFPYVNKYYGNCYTLKFPPAGDSPGGKDDRPMKLVLTSVLGKAELIWP